MPGPIATCHCAQSCQRRVADLFSTALSRQDLQNTAPVRHARRHVGKVQHGLWRCLAVLPAALAISAMLAASARAQEEGEAAEEKETVSAGKKGFRLYRWQEDYSPDSVYGPIGTMIAAGNSTALGVARIGQLDMTWGINRFLQLHALYSHTFAGQYIRDAGGRSFDYYRLQLQARW